MTIEVEIPTLARVWIFAERIEPRMAEQRLAQFMREAGQQKHREILLDYACANVFWALILASAFVLYTRLNTTGSSTTVLGVLLSVALLGAGIMARWRRPDDLHIAVLADIKLKLKQRLSTAWEFARAQPDSEISTRLAVQVVKQRLPLRSEPVFPVRINTWGKLIPIAVALLVLVNVVDLGKINDHSIIEIDDSVVAEGKRLREFAERLGGLAELEGFPRSGATSEKARQLGTRMESGALSRHEALSRLRQLAAYVKDQRASALYDGAGLGLDTSQLQAAALTRDLESLGVRSMLQSLLDGRLTSSEARGLRLDASTLAQLGIDPAALEQALESFEVGREADLRQILEKLAGVDTALQDAEALSETQAAVDRARENLGDPSADAERGAPGGKRGSAPGGSSDLLGGFRAESIRPGNDPSGMGPGTGYGPDRTEKKSDASGDSSSNPNEIILRPKSQAGVGDVFSAEAKVLPRANQAATDTVELDARYAAQVEQVLSKEDYPLHHKEFIRRYFLGLSLGENPE